MAPILGVFAKVPEPGRVKTRLGDDIGLDLAAEFYAESLAWILKRLSLRDLPFVVFFTPEAKYERFVSMYPFLESVPCVPQCGEDLGERMFNALEYLDSEYERTAILLGSDSPDLPFDQIYRAREELEDGRDLVIGPAIDGGYYLIGMNEPNEELFVDMEWSHSEVTAETINRARENELDYTLLKEWRDYDQVEDLLSLIEE